MTQILAIEYIDNRPVADHHFPIAAEGDNSYRAILSYNAFDKHHAAICLRNCMERRFWPLCGHGIDMIRHMDEYASKMGHPPEPRPQHHHKDIWAFYKAIGYDYKKKRFTSAKN